MVRDHTPLIHPPELLGLDDLGDTGVQRIRIDARRTGRSELRELDTVLVGKALGLDVHAAQRTTDSSGNVLLRTTVLVALQPCVHERIVVDPLTSNTGFTTDDLRSLRSLRSLSSHKRNPFVETI